MAMLSQKIRALTRFNGAAWSISVEQTRTGVNFQSRNPREPHYDRKRMLKICKPIIPREHKPAWETCTKVSNLPQEMPPHPYEKLLAEDLKKEWFSSRFMCFFHINPVCMNEKRQIRNMFYKEGINFFIYGYEVVKLVIQDTAYASALHLFQAPTAIVFCPEEKISKALKLSRKVPQITLLAGIVDGIFLSRQQLQGYSKLPGKEPMYQQLSYLLNTASSNVSKSLTNQTELLSHYLKQHSEGDKSSKEE